MLNKVSVIITSYNREDMIVNAISSVVNQKYKEIEIIVVDDCSKDNTKGVVENYIDENKLTNIVFLINEKNMGANYSRNRGVESSTGKYISFLDDDDEYYPTKIEEQVTLMQKYDDKAIVYCGFNIYKCDDKIAQTKLRYEGDILDKLLEDNFLGNPSLLLLRKTLIETSFDNTFPACQDWDLVTRLAKKYKFYHTNSMLVKVNKHEGESIGAGPKAIKGFEMYYTKHIDKYSFFKFIKTLILYIFRAIKNRQSFQIKKAIFLAKAYFGK